MANKNKLAELLKNRNPLSQTREAVKPVNMYTNPQVDIEAKQDQPSTESTQVDKTTSTQVHKEVSSQTDKPASSETSKTTTPLVVKYTTHLKPETIKAIKMLAVTTDRKDYEIVEEAVEAYLKERGDTHN
jgi:predicted DNA-binding protein